MGKYDDILNLPHHVSRYHKQMSLENRAAQFAPFAALTGHEEAIEETARITDAFKDLTQEEKNILADKLSYALEKNKCVKITYFKADSKKRGGVYETIKGFIDKYDDYSHFIYMQDGTELNVDLISDLKIIKKH